MPTRRRAHTRRRRQATRHNLPLILVLSAGAPHSPLAAGALYALQEHMVEGAGRHFDVIMTSGGGALIGLLFVAPTQGDPRGALRDIVNWGVADPIYRLFPLGYKTFFKPGPFTPLF